MHKVKISTYHENKKPEEKKINQFNKCLIIDDYLFDIALRKGLIEKTENGYIFIGEYEDLLAIKRKKNLKSDDWLD